jgi:predicted small metal-binding protein
MAGVKCPVCNDKLSGQTTAELNAELKEHLAEAHQLEAATTWKGDEPSRYTPEAVKQRQEVGQWKPPGGPETNAEREATTWSGEEESKETAVDKTARQEAGQWEKAHGPKTAIERDVTTWKSPSSPENVEQRERLQEEVTEWKNPRAGQMQKMEMAPMVNCPLCDEAIKGSDEENLSEELKDHMTDVHQDRLK